MDEHSLLQEGLGAANDTAKVKQLTQYLDLLEKWNKAYNLTALRKRTDMVSLHVLDSLAIMTWVQGDSLLDVGTGAGLPGIVLAIAKPELNIVLLDSNGKKTRFLREVKRLLCLNNVEVVQSRVENYHHAQGFDTVVSRAFSSLKDFTKKTQHLVKSDGIFLAMKGKYPTDELALIEHVYEVKSYRVAHIDGARSCVIIEKE